MKLAGLPHFTVHEVQRRDTEWLLFGAFDHLNTVREDSGWLYVSPDYCISGELEALSQTKKTACFRTNNEPLAASELVGESIPWIDGYWQAYYVTLILDADHKWNKVTFSSSPAVQRHIPGWFVVRKAEGATQEEGDVIVPNGWDHEHCFHYCPVVC